MKFDNNSANHRISSKLTLEVESSVLNPTINFSFGNSNLKEPKQPSALDFRREIRMAVFILKHEMNEIFIKSHLLLGGLLRFVHVPVDVGGWT